MTRRGLIDSVVIVLTVCFVVKARAAFPSGGEYDSAGRANAVDADASGALPAFRARVADAFTQGFGGVVDFEGGGVTGNNVLDFDFGPGGNAKRLRLSASDNLGHYNHVPPFFDWVEPISGDRSLGSLDLVQGGSDPDLFFIPTALTGGAAGEALAEIGFTLLSRQGAAQDVAATAQFSDGSSSGERVDLSVGDGPTVQSVPVSTSASTPTASWSASVDLDRKSVV